MKFTNNNKRVSRKHSDKLKVVWANRQARDPTTPRSLKVSTPVVTRGREATPRFNPGRFSNALTENYYVKGIGAGVNLGLEQQELIDWFQKKHNDDDASMKLAAKINACKRGSRCFSAACPKCSHAAQAFVTETVSKFLEHHPDRKDMVCASVIPRDGEIPPGSLSAASHARSVRRWKEGLGRAGVTWFIGATDWSFNEHDQGRYNAHWSEHFYGLMATKDVERLKRSLQEQFPRTDAIDRPVHVKAWNGDPKAIQYMINPTFWRRIGTDEAQRQEKDGVGTRTCRATDKQPLRAKQKIELLHHLNEIGIQGRFLMRWLQFVNLESSGWTVVNRAPISRRHGK